MKQLLKIKEMKRNSLIFIMILAGTAIYAQGTDNHNFTTTNSFNALTGTYNKSNNFEVDHKTEREFESSIFDPDCSTDFWTVNTSGYIQQWSLLNDSITGGDTILRESGNGRGLAYCGDLDSPTFYISTSGGIEYYDSISGWQYIPTDDLVLNNGGHQNDQYYMGIANGTTILYYFDGLNFTTIDSLASGVFPVADIAVDSLGRAWVFKGNAPSSVTTLNVYDHTGMILSYNITFNSNGAYGSFFLNDTLYLGMADVNPGTPNSVIPILITGGVAKLGTPISFPYNNYADMASCQHNESSTTSISEISNSDINIFPNPTNGIINLSTPINTISIEIYNLNGQMIAKLKQQREVDLTGLPDGMYIVKIITPNREYHKKIIKR